MLKRGFGCGLVKRRAIGKVTVNDNNMKSLKFEGNGDYQFFLFKASLQARPCAADVMGLEEG